MAMQKSLAIGNQVQSYGIYILIF